MLALQWLVDNERWLDRPIDISRRRTPFFYTSSPCDLERCYLLVLVSSGLIAAPFRGYSSVLEVLCSGEALNPDLDLLTMVLYETASHSVLATLSVASRECSTGSSFTSCTFSAGDSRRTRISTLVTDLAEGEQRDYGCNVTSFRSGDRAYFTSWITTALRLSMYEDDEETGMCCCDVM